MLQISVSSKTGRTKSKSRNYMKTAEKNGRNNENNEGEMKKIGEAEKTT